MDAPAMPDWTVGATASGVCALLRDTFLLVSALKLDGTAETVESLRSKCLALVQNLASELARRGEPTDVRQDVQGLQCGLLDEIVLRALGSDDDRAKWEAEPLQVRFLGRHDAGTWLFERLETRMREAQPRRDLLQAWAAALQAGFLGRHALDPKGHRQVVEALDAKLAGMGNNTRTSRAERPRQNILTWCRQLPPWGLLLLSGVAALLVYLAWSGALALQLSHLLRAAH